MSRGKHPKHLLRIGANGRAQGLVVPGPLEGSHGIVPCTAPPAPAAFAVLAVLAGLIDAEGRRHAPGHV